MDFLFTLLYYSSLLNIFKLLLFFIGKVVFFFIIYFKIIQVLMLFLIHIPVVFFIYKVFSFFHEKFDEKSIIIFLFLKYCFFLLILFLFGMELISMKYFMATFYGFWGGLFHFLRFLLIILIFSISKKLILLFVVLLLKKFFANEDENLLDIHFLMKFWKKYMNDRILFSLYYILLIYYVLLFEVFFFESFFLYLDLDLSINNIDLQKLKKNIFG